MSKWHESCARTRCNLMYTVYPLRIFRCLQNQSYIKSSARDNIVGCLNGTTRSPEGFSCVQDCPPGYAGTANTCEDITNVTIRRALPMRFARIRLDRMNVIVHVANMLSTTEKYAPAGTITTTTPPNVPHAPRDNILHRILLQ